METPARRSALCDSEVPANIARLSGAYVAATTDSEGWSQTNNAVFAFSGCGRAAGVRRGARKQSAGALSHVTCASAPHDGDGGKTSRRPGRCASARTLPARGVVRTEDPAGAA